MTTSKAYIYEMDNLRAVVCAYSIDLFHFVLKNARTDSECYVKELETVSHRVFHRSSCNCKETVRSLGSKSAGRLSSFERVLVPLEFLELERAHSVLLLCEFRRHDTKSRCALKVLNMALSARKGGKIDKKRADDRPKYCLLRLCAIFDLRDDGGGLCDSVGVNNSVSLSPGKLGKCLREVARELAGRGVSPGAVAQKCVHSRDTNRCWFDYGRIMDICIHYKLTAREIAEVIKHVAAVDPLQPDPVHCIRGHLGAPGKRAARPPLSPCDPSERLSSSESSSGENTTSSSSSGQLVLCKSRSSNKMRPNKNHRVRSDSRRKERRTRNLTKETQTSNCTQSETQTEFYQCRCFAVKSNLRLPNTTETKYLWDPNDYEANDYGEPIVYDEECLEDPEIYDEDLCDDLERNDNYDINNLDSQEDGYDSKIYEDFLRQSEYLDKDDDFEADIEGTQLYGGADINCGSDGMRRRLSSLSTRIQPSRRRHMKASADSAACSKYGNDKLRSASQPILATKVHSFNLMDNSSNSLGQCSQRNVEKVKVMTLVKKPVDCCTQTLAASMGNREDEESQSKLKKSVSESNICQKVGLEDNENNSSRVSTNVLSNVGVNTCLSFNSSKAFKMECSQTEFGFQYKEDQFLDSQLKYEALNPKFIFRRLEKEKDNHSDINNKVIDNHNPSAISSRSKKIPYIEDSHWSKRTMCGDVSRALNRNANNHSISRSPSSRNSQIVEVDNENMEKISSVIVDQDSRPIIYYNLRIPEPEDVTAYPVDFNPFYEKGDVAPNHELIRPNTNVSNSIRSVTVSNKNPCNEETNKCSIPGCPNSADGFNYTCENHAVSMSPSCSPERCLSRLSCIVALNRHFVDYSISPDHVSTHKAALHRVIYGPYDEVNCTETLTELRKQQFDLSNCRNSLVFMENQYPISANDQNPIINRKQNILAIDNHPVQSAMRLSKGQCVECYPLDINSPTGNPISDMKKIQNHAKVECQSEQEEFVTAIHSSPVLESKNAALTRCFVDSTMASCLKNTIASIEESVNVQQKGSLPDIPLPKKETEKEVPTSSHAIFISDDEKNKRTSLFKKSIISNIKVNRSCNRDIPINFQVCPISGCRNITTTGQPPCLKLGFCDKKNENPERIQNNLYVTSPYLTADTKRIPQINCHITATATRAERDIIREQNMSSTKHSFMCINHGQIHNYNGMNDNEIVFNDSLETPPKPLSINDDNRESPIGNCEFINGPLLSEPNINPHEEKRKRNVEISKESEENFDVGSQNKVSYTKISVSMKSQPTSKSLVDKETSTQTHLHGSLSNIRESLETIDEGTTVEQEDLVNPENNFSSIKIEVQDSDKSTLSHLNSVTNQPSFKDNMEPALFQQYKSTVDNLSPLSNNVAVLRNTETFESIRYNPDGNESMRKSSKTKSCLSPKVKPLSMRTVSASSRQTLDTANVRLSEVDMQAYSDKSSNTIRSGSSKNTREGNDWINNSSSIVIPSKENLKDLDYLYLDSSSTKVRSRIFSNSLLFKDPDCLLLGQCRNQFYSIPEVILNRQSNKILVSERWDIHSDILLENLDSITLTLPALVDHPNNIIILLVSLSVYLLFCEQIPILMHTAKLQFKARKSKIIRLFKSIRPTKFQQLKDKNSSKVIEKSELIKNFKIKMVNIIKKCRRTKLRNEEKNSHLSTFSTNFTITTKNTEERDSCFAENASFISQSAIDKCENHFCTESCIHFGRLTRTEFGDNKHWNSEPALKFFAEMRTDPTGTLDRSLFSPTEISTSDLSLLCAEVLRKMDGKLILDYEMKEKLSKSSQKKLTNSRSHSCSSKDTLKLIIKALKYLHHSQLEESGPSNKTLDSVSSIKTCSGDRLESIASLRKKIVQTQQDDNITISAFTKTF